MTMATVTVVSKWVDDTTYFAREYGNPDYILCEWDGEQRTSRKVTKDEYDAAVVTDDWTIQNAVTAWSNAEIDRHAAEMQERREAAEAAVVRPGRIVEVYKGRKVKVGTVGEVLWMGGQFRSVLLGLGSRNPLTNRYDNTVYAYEDNVRVMTEPKEASPKEASKLAWNPDGPVVLSEEASTLFGGRVGVFPKSFEHSGRTFVKVSEEEAANHEWWDGELFMYRAADGSEFTVWND